MGKGTVSEILDATIERLREIEERSAGKLMRPTEGAIVTFLETLRDTRWQLMAFRAELEDQRGEVFTDSKELLRSLRGLP